MSAHDDALLALAKAIADNTAVTQQLVARLAPTPSDTPPELSPDELFHKGLEEIRGPKADVEKIGLVVVIEGCTSDLGVVIDGVTHAATFDAELQFRPVIDKGKLTGRAGVPTVRALRDYTLPAGHDVPMAAGGLVPDGIDIERDPNRRGKYDQWLWETFWQADLRRFVGKALPQHIYAASKTAATQAPARTAARS